jgi:hypothetical protein
MIGAAMALAVSTGPYGSFLTGQKLLGQTDSHGRGSNLLKAKTDLMSISSGASQTALEVCYQLRPLVHFRNPEAASGIAAWIRACWSGSPGSPREANDNEMLDWTSQSMSSCICPIQEELHKKTPPLCEMDGLEILPAGLLGSQSVPVPPWCMF